MRHSCHRWGALHGAWDVAKLFNRQTTPSDAPRAADTSELCSIMFYYEGAFRLRRERALCEGVSALLTIRNGTFGHVATCELGDADADAAVATVRRFLGLLRRRRGSLAPEVAYALARIKAMADAGDGFFVGAGDGGLSAAAASLLVGEAAE